MNTDTRKPDTSTCRLVRADLAPARQPLGDTARGHPYVFRARHLCTIKC